MGLLDSLSSTLARLTGRPPRQQLEFEPRPHYFYLASYPKSGNTWLRFLIANLIAEDEIGLRGFGRYVPDSHLPGDRAAMDDLSSPFNRGPRQFVKTHLRYQPVFQNAVYLVRDGRDAITSYYHWANARRPQPVSLHEIIVGKTPWGRWSDHVLGWMGGPCNRLLLRYEELYADTAGELRRVLDFAGLPAPTERVSAAVAASSFASMREKERLLRGDSEGEWERQAHGADQQAAPADGRPLFTRRGGPGDWRNLFGPEEEALFWKHHRAGMEAAGYGD